MGVAISLSRLAAAVANEGCIGVIAASGVGMNEPDFHTSFLKANMRALRNEIRKAKSMTDGILGLNIMVALSTFADWAQVAIEEEIDIIFAGAGLPLSLPQYRTAGSKTMLVPIVSSARAAGLICKSWMHKWDCLPDAVVLEGPKAGGHLGFKESQIFDPDFALEKLLPAVLDEVGIYANRYGKHIPVIAAGGIYTGSDILKFMRMGAAGVQMGTRFVATDECDADPRFKQAYVDATEDEIVIIKSPVGMPGRAIRNKYIEDVESGQKKPYKCPFHCIITCDFTNSPYCIADALTSAQRGNLTDGFAFSGANAYRVKEIVSVKQLVESLLTEAREAEAAT
jgi:nitronate monooxygenase